MLVKQLQLHKAMFVPSGFNLPRTVVNSSQSCPGIKMELHEHGVMCSWKNTVFLIPYVCVECAVLGEPPPPKGSKKE